MLCCINLSGELGGELGGEFGYGVPLCTACTTSS